MFGSPGGTVRSVVAVLGTLSLLLVATPSAGHAQEGEPLKEGTRVRLLKDGARRAGVLERLTDDSLFVRTESSRPVLAVSRDALRWIDVSRGKKRKTWTGLLVGAGTGLVGGIVIGATVVNEDPWCPGCAEAAGAVVGLGGGAVVGLVAGTLIRTERWRRIHLRGAATSGPGMGPGPGMIVGVRLRL